MNVVAPFQMVRAARGALEKSGSADVVMVSSVAGIVGQGSSIPYCASKAALNNLVVTLAKALAPRIRVNAVAPGAITGRWLKQGWGDSYDAVMNAVAQRVPLGRAVRARGHLGRDPRRDRRLRHGHRTSDRV